MKVNTDGVLLGAWANVPSAGNILDIGTGTGVIALMMAQRTAAEITAIEIDETSCREAISNVKNSPWQKRITVLHTDFQLFANNSPIQFDLIISNPPFFENDFPSPNHRRKTARHNDSLPVKDLIEGCQKLLTLNGTLALILPIRNTGSFTIQANAAGLYIKRKTYVKPNPEKPPHRLLMELSKHKGVLNEESLTIEFEEHNNFTPEYKTLTRDFYLAF